MIHVATARRRRGKGLRSRKAKQRKAQLSHAPTAPTRPAGDR